MQAKVTGLVLDTRQKGSWIYTFGPFTLDPARGTLHCGSQAVALPSRLFALLLKLVRANGAVVSRDDLHRLIWPDGRVGDNNLSQHVYMLRRILADWAGDRLYINTEHSKGFRLVAPVRIVKPSDDDLVQPVRRPLTPRADLILDAIRHHNAGSDLLVHGRAATLLLAAEHFELSLQFAPSFVPALVGLTRAYLALARNSYLPGDHALPKARDAVVRSLEIDPASAEAHAMSALCTLVSDWDWREAKRELDTATRLNPESLVVAVSAGLAYEWLGQTEKAIEEFQRGCMIQPPCQVVHLALCRALIARGEYKESIAHLSRLIEAGHKYADRARRYRAEALVLNGNYKEALLDLTVLSGERSEDLAWRLALLGRACVGLGEREKAREIYAALLAAGRTEYVAHSSLIALALKVGKVREAIHHLKCALDRREAGLPLLRRSPALSPIRSTPEFKSLVAAVSV